MTSLRCGAATDTGQVRANNQDAVLLADPVFAVADGMGGHAAGEIASQVAVESLQDAQVSSLDALVEAVRHANRTVWERASEDPELRGMGTTLCAIALVPGEAGEQVVVVNVGDSRVYQLHDGDLVQLTDDHSLVEDLVREGRLSPQEARTHPQRNILTRVLGNDADVEVDSWTVDPHRGDRFLLCSDGLFNEVDDDKIASVLRRLADPEDAAHELVSLALQGGGRDNVSVVVVDVADHDGPGAAAATGAAEAPTKPIGGSHDTASMASVAPADGAGGGGGGPGGGVAAPPDTTGGVPASPRPPASAPPTRRVTWRSLLFVASVLAVLVGAVGAVAWFARSTYHVGVRDDQVAILRGRPGGLLWFQPTLAETTDLSIEDLPPGRRDAVLRGKEEPSLAAARSYVGSLEEQAEAERRRTTTTSSTTTVAGQPPAPSPTPPPTTG